jgi:predicted ABC-type ATPase
MPTLYILAGPNGAGKTTAAYRLLPDVFKTVEFVNADEISRGLSPLNVDSVSFQAGNFSKYAKEADSWYLYDNSGAEYVLIAKCIEGEKEIFNFEVLNKITEI